MKIQIFLVAASISLAACSGSGESNTVSDSATDKTVLPDSVPRTVMVGKGGDWAYKPDSAMNDLILGSVSSMKNWTAHHGAEFIGSGDHVQLPYINLKNRELLYVHAVPQGGVKFLPYAFTLKRTDTSVVKRKDMHVLNFANEANFITGHGIYLGMPVDYVQSVYKSQPMMQWIKGDTTYLAYAPSDKDSVHYSRYPHIDYSCLYKFTNDQLVELQMSVDPETIKNKK